METPNGNTEPKTNSEATQDRRGTSCYALKSPAFEHDLGQTIFYLKNNRIHSAVVVTRMLVENAHDDWVDTKDHSWQRFGVTGERYVTCHGVVEAREAFATRDELKDSIAAPCSSITLNFQGDTSKPHDICESDYGKLKASGFLWEFYPDAPDVFPTNAEVCHGANNQKENNNEKD